MASPARPRRSTRRTAIIDSDDEDDVSNTTANTTKIQEDEEEFSPEVKKSTRRTTRGSRQSTASVASAAPSRGRGRPRKTPTPAPSEPPSDGPQADDVIIKPEPDSVKKVLPKKRKSHASQSSISSLPDSAPATPTQPSASRATSQVPPSPSPLADITTSSVNSQTPDDTQATIKPIKPMEAIMEKPMDIVLKSRTMTIPVVEDLTPKPRIVLTHLILVNFKSYAGRQEVGPFHASFSSVVGPNGSGKSNVIDSLLFVFGFRASKMRQGKISALIHNSAEHPNLDHCEVAVHFQEVMDQVCLAISEVVYIY